MHYNDLLFKVKVRHNKLCMRNNDMLVLPFVHLINMNNRIQRQWLVKHKNDELRIDRYGNVLFKVTVVSSDGMQ